MSDNPSSSSTSGPYHHYHHDYPILEGDPSPEQQDRTCPQCANVLAFNNQETFCPMCGSSLECEASPTYETGRRASSSDHDYYPKSYEDDGRDHQRHIRNYNSYHGDHDRSSFDERNYSSRHCNDSRRDQVSYDESNSMDSSYNRDTYSRRFREEDRDRYASRYRYSNNNRDEAPRYRDDKRKRTDYQDESHRRYQDDDYYQDRSYRRDDRRGHKEREWPPSFESSGASYIFDNRSGLFYEASSNFFYDPKTKLYFGNKQQKYYQYTPDSNPPFQEVVANGQVDGILGGNSEVNKQPSTVAVFPFSQNPSQDVAAADDLIIKALGGSSSAITNADSAGTGGKKKRIAISLKKSVDSTFPGDSNHGEAVDTSTITETIEVETMNVKDKESAKDLDSVLISSKLQKLHEADIDKWSQRGRELKNNDPRGTTDTTETKLVKLTVSGHPICMICKRKFPCLEKLQQHEQLSDLHKQNLAKLASMESSAVAEAIQYRDRALERRILYPDPHVITIPSGLKNATAFSDKTEEIQPSQILNEEHIGNKMLQKLGWTGGSLGKSHDDANSSQLEVIKNTASEKLREDWERIETLSTKRP